VISDIPGKKIYKIRDSHRCKHECDLRQTQIVGDRYDRDKDKSYIVEDIKKYLEPKCIIHPWFIGLKLHYNFLYGAGRKHLQKELVQEGISPKKRSDFTLTKTRKFVVCQ